MLTVRFIEKLLYKENRQEVTDWNLDYSIPFLLLLGQWTEKRLCLYSVLHSRYGLQAFSCCFCFARRWARLISPFLI